MGKPLGRKQNIGIESRETMAKILAVDDEPAILEMIESILNKDGHRRKRIFYAWENRDAED